MKTIVTQLNSNGVLVAFINVPERSMNVITPELTEDLYALVEQLQTNEAIKGAIITSGKPGSFVAGADLADIASLFDREVSAQEGAEMASNLARVFRLLETNGKPVVAAINGLALGGGLELCLACHHRVAATDSKVVLGLPEVKLGLLPGAGGTQRLPRMIGIPAALPLLIQGQQIDVGKALNMGIIQQAVTADQLLETAEAWVLANPKATQPWDKKGFRVPKGAGPLAPHAGESFVAGNAVVTSMTYGNYPAPNAIMSCVYEGTQVAIDVGLRIEAKYFGTLIANPVAGNMIKTLFLNKGAAYKLAARPKDVAKLDLKKVGILGAGMMGAGIAHVSAKAGLDVVLLDSTIDQANAGKEKIAALQQKDIKRGKTTEAKATAILDRITTTHDYADLEGCDLIVEAVFESREIKADVTAKAEAVIAETAVFGSNTSTLPITGLATKSSRPANYIGIHFFSPVEKMPLVEIIVGEQTSQATIAHTLDFIGKIRKTPIVVNDYPGFYTSRVFGSFTQEGLKMLLDGVKPELIENAAKQAGFPVGPLAVSDEVTLQLQQAIFRQQDADQVPARFLNHSGRNAIDRMVDEFDRRGKRFGKGFYDYPEGQPKTLWPGLAQAFPLAAEQPSIEELKLRFLTMMALETYRSREDGVLNTAIDADLGSILGIGFPAWTGGCASYIRTIGEAAFVEQCKSLAAKHGDRFEPSAAMQAKVAAGESLSY